MAFDREDTLKKAEKLLRQGRLDAAISEYVRVVEDQPRDWNTANTLGDLYARAGQTDMAVAQYSRIADHLKAEGFYPKAAALYKKILKINRDDEATQLQLAEVSASQGLLADAKSLLNAVAARRRNRSDRRGEAEIVVRLGDIDPADFAARLKAARTVEGMGEAERAARRYKDLHDDLMEKGRTEEALDALRQFARLSPHDRGARALLARAALASGDAASASDALDRDTAGDDPVLLFAFAETRLHAGELDAAREALTALLTVDPASREKVLDLGWSMQEQSSEAAVACADAVAEAAIGRAEFGPAAVTLQQLVSRVPGHVPALLRLVEVCVDGGLESEMYAAQEQLTDAYLERGQASEARVIAEDLVAREPWEEKHIARFRRALVMLRVPEPDTLIAERLSGQAPFMATDRFVDLPDEPPAAAVQADTESSAPAPDRLVKDAPAPVTAGTSTSHAASSGPAVDEIDLSGELGTLDSGAGIRATEPAGTLDQVFEKIRDDAGSTPDYADQHMTLARTFLEIGQVDQAIGALKVAAKSLRHRFEAASRLGRLFRERGQRVEAIEWLEHAAEAPAPAPEEARAVMYDLGVGLDEAGEVARALAVFLELQSEAGDYRDVPARIDRLARVQAGG